MSGDISVVDFKHIPGKNDLEYIKLLKKALHRQIILTNKAVAKIKALSPAQPERKTGRWEMKPDPYGFFDEIPVCSECGCTTKMREVYKFCPNCGADMRMVKDEQGHNI